MYYAYRLLEMGRMRDTCITYRRGGAMAEESVDLKAVQRIKAKLDRVLEEYPELQESNLVIH